MARTMFEQLAALREPEPKPASVYRAGLLPKSNHKLTSTSTPKVPKLVPNPDFDPNGHPPAYKRHQKRLEGMVSPTLHHALIIASRRSQALTGQSENVEKHMSLTKPVNHKYPEPIHAHDRALDWERPDAEIERKKRVRDRANAALRKAFDELNHE